MKSATGHDPASSRRPSVDRARVGRPPIACALVVMLGLSSWMAGVASAGPAAAQTLLDLLNRGAGGKAETRKKKRAGVRLPKAFLALRKKALQGDVVAMVRIARILDPQVKTEAMPGVRKSLAGAARWYRRAAQAGDRDAQFRLARIVHLGGKGIRQSPATAVVLYRAAARQGHPEAMLWLGWALEMGEGTRRDPAKAMEWYEKAAQAGEVRAMTALGLMHLTGAAGVRDLRKAREWLEKAAAAGDAWAVNDLAAIHEMAWGVGRDLEKARQLYARAADMGLTQAASNLKRVERKLAATGETAHVTGGDHETASEARRARGRGTGDDDTAGDGAADAGIAGEDAAEKGAVGRGVAGKGARGKGDPLLPSRRTDRQ